MFTGNAQSQKGFKDQKSEVFGEPTMNLWPEQITKELSILTKKGFVDKKIAEELSNKFNRSITENGVKRKRHRMKIFKKPKKVINDTTFYVNIRKRKNSKKYEAVYFPLKIAKKVGLTDKDIIIYKAKNTLFVSTLRKQRRLDRPNDYFLFYIPFKVFESNQHVIIEQLKFIKKIDKFQTTLPPLFTEKNSKVFLDLYVLLKKSTNKITIFLYSKKLFACPLKAKIPDRLPRHIELNEKLLQAVGFFQGEGSKTHPRRVEVVNSNVELINLFLEYFEKTFFVDRELWKARVIYTDQKKSLKKEERLKNFWSEKTRIPEKNFSKTSFIKGNYEAENGSLQAYLPKIIFREVWMSIVNNVGRLLEKRTDFSKWFLQGVLAADGSPIVSKGRLDCLQIRLDVA